MKKKLFTLGLAGMIGLVASTTVLASEEFSRTQTIPGEGHIGPQNPDDGFDPNTIVNVSVPTNVQWWVTENTNGQVQSAEYRITNLSERANLSVTLVSYTQENNVSIPDGLTLNLTGDLREDAIGVGSDIIGFQGGTTPFSSVLLSEAGEAIGGINGSNEWRFGFDGTFVGTIPATALVPTFDMVMEFDVHSYTVN